AGIWASLPSIVEHAGCFSPPVPAQASRLYNPSPAQIGLALSGSSPRPRSIWLALPLHLLPPPRPFPPEAPLQPPAFPRGSSPSVASRAALVFPLTPRWNRPRAAEPEFRSP